jgi:hypothetical protein
MNEQQIQSLTDICIRKGLHYSELRPIINSYKKRTNKRINTTEIVGRVRTNIYNKYPNGQWHK